MTTIFEGEKVALIGGKEKTKRKRKTIRLVLLQFDGGSLLKSLFAKTKTVLDWLGEGVLIQ